MGEKPRIRISKLHARNLPPIERLDWPEDGIGWNGEVPDTIVIGGINGSGKTTLLEAMVAAFETLEDEKFGSFAPYFDTADSFLAMDLGLVPGKEGLVRWIADERFSREKRFVKSDIARPRSDGELHYYQELFPVEDLVRRDENGEHSYRVLYFPSEREWISPETEFKAVGKLEEPDAPVYRWRRPEKWEQSAERLLYNADWKDGRALRDGRPEEAGAFESYARVFDKLSDGRKRLVWDKEDLLIEVEGGKRHPIDSLSSGERQLLLLGVELDHRWKPGSIVLIDEPELHLEAGSIARLWGLLTGLRKERGGQLIAATQSSYLFELADPGTTMLLGEGNL
ncbi:MAG: ATP-binding protein [Polyangia bacterium]